MDCTSPEGVGTSDEHSVRGTDQDRSLCAMSNWSVPRTRDQPWCDRVRGTDQQATGLTEPVLVSATHAMVRQGQKSVVLMVTKVGDTTWHKRIGMAVNQDANNPFGIVYPSARSVRGTDQDHSVYTMIGWSVPRTQDHQSCWIPPCYSLSRLPI